MLNLFTKRLYKPPEQRFLSIQCQILWLHTNLSKGWCWAYNFIVWILSSFQSSININKVCTWRWLQASCLWRGWSKSVLTCVLITVKKTTAPLQFEWKIPKVIISMKSDGFPKIMLQISELNKFQSLLLKTELLKILYFCFPCISQCNEKSNCSIFCFKNLNFNIQFICQNTWQTIWNNFESNYNQNQRSFRIELLSGMITVVC